ncbi:hypothetical protein [Thermanaerothrix sp.]|uniref:hypothetical protein n=1 Tax=Thermanaerothrix sp. TaxID=2972675 RepID=UPI003C7D33D4
MRRAIILTLVLVLLVIQSLTAIAQSSAPGATATMEAIRATEAARSALGMEKELPANDFTPLVTFLMGLVMAGVVMALMRSEIVSVFYRGKRPGSPADHPISTEGEAERQEEPLELHRGKFHKSFLEER